MSNIKPPEGYRLLKPDEIIKKTDLIHTSSRAAVGGEWKTFEQLRETVSGSIGSPQRRRTLPRARKVRTLKKRTLPVVSVEEGIKIAEESLIKLRPYQKAILHGSLYGNLEGFKRAVGCKVSGKPPGYHKIVADPHIGWTYAVSAPNPTPPAESVPEPLADYVISTLGFAYERHAVAKAAIDKRTPEYLVLWAAAKLDESSRRCGELDRMTNHLGTLLEAHQKVREETIDRLGRKEREVRALEAQIHDLKAQLAFKRQVSAPRKARKA